MYIHNYGMCFHLLFVFPHLHEQLIITELHLKETVIFITLFI